MDLTDEILVILKPFAGHEMIIMTPINDSQGYEEWDVINFPNVPRTFE